MMLTTITEHHIVLLKVMKEETKLLISIQPAPKFCLPKVTFGAVLPYSIHWDLSQGLLFYP